MTKKNIFDIGANNGSDSYHYANDPSNIVYAFEPTPFLLKTYLYPIQKENYIVVPVAISDFDGEDEFNIAGQSDWGCSSLNEFSDGLSETWPGRTDFHVTEKIKVKVQRMDTFILENNIEEIEYMHCDTQGSDLKVLKSFGIYINRLKSGVVEACKQNPLYKSIDNTESSIIKFLVSNNFSITNIQSNNGCPNEVNISFVANQ